jgi:hypothetical protein
MDKIKFYGQAHQDMFVSIINNFKKNGTFLEIGSNEPIYCSNTYTLEKEFGWTGIMVEYLPFFLTSYKLYRPRSIHIIEDATKVNYLDYLKQFPERIDYLQIDLDANNRSTLTTLENLNKNVLDKYRFSTITFEHDIYTGDHFNTREISRKIFSDRGYIRLFSNVSVFYENKFCEFEDWYVDQNILDNQILHSVLNDSENIEGINCKKCIEILSKYI